ncbi:ATP-dependent helicase [Fusobacterium sp.]|uniref:ATP-dependent helicase n=1 Tax=Fusobacterium sp. TaxID=68766 RepID=UPI00290173D7|nr:ATP-dependent helicase [Fusobacterium sp.]MDU1910244.1 ATP-dependent helicase [Fusobacterium sp.]
MKYFIKKLEKHEVKDFNKDILTGKYKINYYNELNEEQLRALTSLEGQYLVIAGAGSGKTRTIVYRTAFMIERGIPEENILMLTFTKKAALEMKERLRHLVSDKEKEVSISTFHSLCAELLTKYKNIFGIEKLNIIDENKNNAVISLLIREYALKKKNNGKFLSEKRVIEIFEAIRSRKKNIIEFLSKEERIYLDDLEFLKIKYRKFKKEFQIYDFEDLIEKVLEKLKSNKIFLKLLREKYKYIIVDEYQDTNSIQKEFLKILVGMEGNIMAVGDDYQSIYGFRGADFKNILRFGKDFHNSKLIKLEKNYRSSDEIIQYVNKISEDFLLKYNKNTKGTMKKGENPHIISFLNEEKQGEFICRKIKELEERGIPYEEIAVLYRNKYIVHKLERLMKEKDIPFNLQEDKEIFFGSPLDIYLKILEVWNDKENILKWEELIRILPKNYSYSVLNITRKKETEDKLLNKLIKISDKISNYSIEEILNKCEKLTFEILEIKTVFSKEEIDFFKEVKSSIRKKEDLETYIKELRNILNIEKKITKGKVSLLSVHSSKGLEWEAVFIPTLLEGIFPSNIGEKNLEEEKRLFYVACSRGKKYLYLLYPEYFYEKVGYFDKKSSFLK